MGGGWEVGGGVRYSPNLGAPEHSPSSSVHPKLKPRYRCVEGWWGEGGRPLPSLSNWPHARRKRGMFDAKNDLIAEHDGTHPRSTYTPVCLKPVYCTAHKINS